MSSIIEFFNALGKYDFLQSALLTAIMVGIMSGLSVVSLSYAACR
jgi:hypothetical protein